MRMINRYVLSAKSINIFPNFRYAATNQNARTSQPNSKPTTSTSVIQTFGTQPANVNTLTSDVIDTESEVNCKYFQEAIVNGVPVRAYLDLESQCNLIKELTVKGMGLQIEELEKPVIIKGFGNGKIKINGQLNATIKVDQAEAQTKLLVIEDQYQTIPLIIGQPFTENDYIVIIRRGNTLRIFEDKQFEKSDDCLKNLEIPDLPKPKINLWANDSCVIPPNFVGFVSVYS